MGKGSLLLYPVSNSNILKDTLHLATVLLGQMFRLQNLVKLSHKINHYEEGEWIQQILKTIHNRKVFIVCCYVSGSTVSYLSYSLQQTLVR
jgi:hypothetical protein